MFQLCLLKNYLSLQLRTVINMPDIQKGSFWTQVIILILAICCAGLIATRVCAADFQKMEVVHAVFYGFLIVIIICFAAAVLDDNMEKSGIMASVLGAILYICAGALCLEFRDKGVQSFFTSGSVADDYVFAAGIIGVIIGVAFLIQMVLQILQK